MKEICWGFHFTSHYTSFQTNRVHSKWVRLYSVHYKHDTSFHIHRSLMSLVILYNMHGAQNTTQGGSTRKNICPSVKSPLQNLPNIRLYPQFQIKELKKTLPVFKLNMIKISYALFKGSRTRRRGTCKELPSDINMILVSIIIHVQCTRSDLGAHI